MRNIRNKPSITKVAPMLLCNVHFPVSSDNKLLVCFQHSTNINSLIRTLHFLYHSLIMTITNNFFFQVSIEYDPSSHFTLERLKSFFYPRLKLCQRGPHQEKKFWSWVLACIPGPGSALLSACITRADEFENLANLAKPWKVSTELRSIFSFYLTFLFSGPGLPALCEPEREPESAAEWERARARVPGHALLSRPPDTTRPRAPGSAPCRARPRFPRPSRSDRRRGQLGPLPARADQLSLRQRGHRPRSREQQQQVRGQQQLQLVTFSNWQLVGDYWALPALPWPWGDNILPSSFSSNVESNL